MCACACACACACVRACTCACVCVYIYVCVWVLVRTLLALSMIGLRFTTDKRRKCDPSSIFAPLRRVILHVEVAYLYVGDHVKGNYIYVLFYCGVMSE